MNVFKLPVNIPNDDEGRAFIETLRKYLRNTPTQITLRGRGPRRGSVRLQRSLPQNLSTSFAVYFNQKPTTKWVKVVDLTTPTGFRNVLYPTKWHPKNRKVVA